MIRIKRLFKDGYVYKTESAAFIKSDILTDGSAIIEVGVNICPRAADETVDCTDNYIIPGLVDVHTHGRAGYDFNKITDEAVEAMRCSYAKAGTTTVMATLASAPLDELYASSEAINRHREAKGGRATIVGIHLEGRYLNPLCRGAHAAELLAPLSADEAGNLIDAMMPLPVHVSAALELADDGFYKAVISRGATLGLAHSNATYDEAMTAVEKGAVSFTHTFNAMRRIHHREPGNISASMLSDAYSEVICDGEHVHPAMVSMLDRLKQKGKLVLITDSMEGAGCPDGEYSIAGQKVFVKDGRAVNVDGALAGSTLDLFRALKNYMRFCGQTLEEAIPAATSNPAAMVGISDTCGSIKEGMRADLIILDSKETMNILSVVAAGDDVTL